MAGLNKVMIIGRLGKDPETRYTQSGLAVASFNVATSEKFKKQNGETDERTEWHKCTAFGKQAETIEKYLKKGSQVYIEGRLQTDEYEKDGVTRYTTKVIVSGFQFLDSKGSQPHGGQPQAQNSAPVVSDDEIPF